MDAHRDAAVTESRERDAARPGGAPARVVAWLSLACGLYLVVSLHETLRPGRLGAFGVELAQLGVYPPALLSLCAVWLAGVQPGLARDARRFWRLLGASLSLQLLARALWAYLPPGFGWAVSAGEMCARLGLFWAVMSLPSPLRSRGKRVPFWLDVLTVALSATMWAWYFVLAPAVLGGGGVEVKGALAALAGPVADIALLFVVLVVLLHEQRRGLGRALKCFAGWCLLQVGADLAYSYFTLNYIYESAALFFRLFAYASYLLLALTALVQAGPDARGERPRASRGWRAAYRRLPYVALLIAYALLLHASRPYWGTGLGGLIWASGVLTAFAVARQVWTLLESARAKLEAEARFRSLVQHSSDVVAILDARERLTFASPAVERLLGPPADALLGRPLADHVHPEDAERVSRLCAQARGWGEGAPTGSFRVRHQDGEWRHVEAVATDLAGDPSVRGVVLNLRDTTERVVLEQKLAYQALHDALTGLANRTLFKDRLEHELEQSQRRPEGIAVLFLDLDDFKLVNDTLGHAQGDKLLTAVARRLQSATRSSDTVARLGGDEFAVLLSDVTGDEQVTVVAERILASLQRPVPLEGKEVRVASSIGIVCSRPGDRADDLLRDADLAMYQAKREGKGHFAFYAEHMQTEILARLQLEEELRAALAEPAAQFRLEFQPIMDLRSERLTSIEVLTRWRHPERGDVSPAQFIPLAEETGLILPLGRWILEQACRFAASWSGVSGDRHSDVVITVNVSGRQLQEPGFMAEVLETLERTGLPAERLLLEITESVLINDSEQILASLLGLRERGVRWAIDDFGTGYASLGYLRRFPVDVLKIDRSFVSSMDDASAAALANTAIVLGQALSLTTVAEGIETPEQLQKLRDLGCTLGQGFLFARPMPPERLTDFLLHHAPAPADAA